MLGKDVPCSSHNTKGSQESKQERTKSRIPGTSEGVRATKGKREGRRTDRLHDEEFPVSRAFHADLMTRHGGS